MRIHSDKITEADLRAAASAARATLTFSCHGSRKRDHAFEVTLRGESKRRPNSGKRGAADEYAATWDQWGVFLGALFETDRDMTSPYYDGRGEFEFKTNWRFEGSTWPADTHGDHRFEFAGVPYQQSCKKCSATQRWA